MADVYKLVNDSYFLRGKKRHQGNYYLRVYEFTMLDQIHISSRIADHRVGPDESCKALEVWGVVLESNKLLELCAWLFDTKLWVNRQGYCFYDTDDKAVMEVFRTNRLLLNDLFPWSRFGVQPEVVSPAFYNRWDTSDREILVDYGNLEKKEAQLRRCEQKLKESETQVSKCRKLLEETAEEDEKELEEMRKQVEEKEEELRSCRKLLEEEMETKSTVDSLLKSIDALYAVRLSYSNN